MSETLSVIIPLAAGETLWRRLLPMLALAEGDEIILAAATPPPTNWGGAARWLHCARRGRAAQMNIAAAAAKGDVLWFVHADSRPPADAVSRLRRSLAAEKADAAHYFDLRFYDGGAKMRINEFGVRLRCALFGNPFGDQAIAMRKRLFESLGGYAEDAPYGEDHLLMLAARRRGVVARRVGAVIGTSARRYMEEGWWRVVLLFQRLWLRQWLAQWRRR